MVLVFIFWGYTSVFYENLSKNVFGYIWTKNKGLVFLSLLTLFYFLSFFIGEWIWGLFHIFSFTGRTLKSARVLPFFHPNSKLTRNIVGGTSNIPKRYPTIINAHTNKKIRVKVLVISNFQEPEFSFFFFINKYILWRFIDIDSKRASAVISNQITIIFLSVQFRFFIFS